MDENKIELFENKRIRTVWDEEKQEWYLSVSDVVAILTDSADVRQYIKKMRSRDPELNLKWGTICTPVAMIAPDGKKRRTTAANGLTNAYRQLSHEQIESIRSTLGL